MKIIYLSEEEQSLIPTVNYGVVPHTAVRLCETFKITFLINLTSAISKTIGKVNDIRPEWKKLRILSRF